MSHAAADRIREIIIVAKHRNDAYPSPPALRLASQPGAVAVPEGKVPCSCGRAVQTKHGRKEINGVFVSSGEGGDWRGDPYCLYCQGSGFRRRYQRLDGTSDRDEAGHLYDPMTYGADRKGAVKAAPSEKQRFDEPQDSDPWEHRHSVFAFFDRALGALRDHDEVAWYYFTAAYCEGRYGFEDGEPKVGFTAGLVCVRALGFLERRMPVPIRLPGELRQLAEMERRDREIDRAFGSERTISREIGVDRRTVRKRKRGAA